MGNVAMQSMAVFIGGGLGALLRWLLNEKLHSACPSVQSGTLAANLSGAFFIGLALAFFRHWPELRQEVRLFCVTGLLGGLTTFSTFSAEVVQLLEENYWGTALATVASNLGGSLLFTALGLLIGGYIKTSWP